MCHKQVVKSLLAISLDHQSRVTLFPANKVISEVLAHQWPHHSESHGGQYS